MPPLVSNDHNHGSPCGIADVTALILAGGQSSRMGTDKALLTLPSQGTDRLSLLRHTCDAVTPHVFQTYVLSPWPQRYTDLLPPSVALLQEASTTQAGPLVALAQGWSMILADCPDPRDLPTWLLVLACDLPGLKSEILSQWQGSLGLVGDDAIATLPRHQNRWEPLCGFYHRRCLPSLHRAINHQIRSFQQWLADEIVVPLPQTNSHMLRNCNTPAEWQQFLDSIDPP